MTPLCRHCGTCKRLRPRGLCIRCYETRLIRDRYPPTGPTRFYDRVHARPLPDLPTVERPGSEAKIVVMADRFAAGRAVFHPDDVSYLARRGTLTGADDPS